MKQDDHILIVGMFDDRADLEGAVDALRMDGFHESDLSALLPDHAPPRDLEQDHHSRAPQGAAIGASAGGAVGTTLGVLLGLGALAIPGIGPILAAGPIVAVLAAGTVVGAVGAVTGALVGLGIPESEAHRYEAFLRRGGSLLSVHADNPQWAKRARTLLDKFGALDVDTTVEAKAAS